MVTIGQSIVIRGEITSQEGLCIEGRVLGTVIAPEADLIIGETGRIEADVRGMRIVILGHVVGNISATERIELGASAEVRGTLSANQVVLQEGARFDGRIDMGQRSIAAAVAHHRAQSG